MVTRCVEHWAIKVGDNVHVLGRIHLHMKLVLMYRIESAGYRSLRGAFCFVVSETVGISFNSRVSIHKQWKVRRTNCCIFKCGVNCNFFFLCKKNSNPKPKFKIQTSSNPKSGKVCISA